MRIGAFERQEPLDVDGSSGLPSAVLSLPLSVGVDA